MSTSFPTTPPSFSLVHFVQKNRGATAASQGAGDSGQWEQQANQPQQPIWTQFTLGTGSTTGNHRGDLCGFIKQSPNQQRIGGVSVEEDETMKKSDTEKFPPCPPSSWFHDEEGEEEDLEMKTPSNKGMSDGGSDADSPPQKQQWNLWDFVKGFTPPNSPLQRFQGFSLLSGWSGKRPGELPKPTATANRGTTGQERPETKRREVRSSRTTLPTRMKLKGRPNINKIIKKINKKQNGNLKDAQDALVRDFSANSSRASVTSRRSTIAKLMNGITNRSNWLPLSAEDLKSIAAVLKEEGYKSAALYLSDLKLMHIEKNFQWTSHLDRVLRQCKLSVNRGKGPRKKAKEVPEDVWAQERAEEVSQSGRDEVRNGRRLFALGVQWMMREIEIAALTTENFNFNRSLRTVTLTWFECKTDQEGATISRVLQCQCDDSSCGLRCPYDNAMQLVSSAFDSKGGEPNAIATTIKGKEASKHMILKSWQQLFGKEVTGHSTRRSGALQYIRKGWSISQVAFLGRWRSNIILQYADEALQSIPVNASANFNLEKKDNAVVMQASIPTDTVIQQEIVLELKEEIRRLKSGSTSVERRLKELQEKEIESDKPDPHILPGRITSLKSNVVHQNITLLLCTPPHTWRTLCGWHYYNSAYSFSGQSEDVTCQKCINIAQGKEDEKRCS